MNDMEDTPEPKTQEAQASPRCRFFTGTVQLVDPLPAERDTLLAKQGGSAPHSSNSAIRCAPGTEVACSLALVYTVQTPFTVTHVGCDTEMGTGLGGCAGEPDGFP